MASAQLYYWSGARDRYVALHDFYAEQMKVRVLGQFDDLEGQADRRTQEVYEQLNQSYYDGGPYDEADVSEAAYDEGIAHYQALSDLRNQVLLGGLAGMFHQWEKTLRDHLEGELSRAFDPAHIEKQIWKVPTSELLDVFEQFGWAVKSLPFHEKLDALQLIVNVYKHGKGRSLTELHKKYPQHVVDPIAKHMPRGLNFGLEYEWLTVTDEHFEQFADAIRQFWNSMPERLTYEFPAK